MEFTKQPNSISLIHGYNYFSLRFVGLGSALGCQYINPREGDGWSIQMALAFSAVREIIIDLRLVLISSDGLICDKDTLDNWYALPVFSFETQEKVPGFIVPAQSTIEFWFRLYQAPINGYQFAFDVTLLREGVRLRSNLFTVFEFCDISGFRALVDAENSYPTRIAPSVIDERMEHLFKGEEIAFQITNFMPCSAYYLGSYKLPVIRENEASGEVVCRSPPTPPSTLATYPLGVLVDVAPEEALSYGPHNMRYSYRNVSVNKIFALLAEDLGFLGQESILIELSTISPWERTIEAVDFVALIKMNILPVADLQFYFLDALALGINDFEFDVAKLSRIDVLSISHCAAFIGWIDLLMFLILDVKITISLTLYYQLLDCAVMGGFDGTIAFLLSHRSKLELLFVAREQFLDPVASFKACERSRSFSNSQSIDLGDFKERMRERKASKIALKEHKLPNENLPRLNQLQQRVLRLTDSKGDKPSDFMPQYSQIIESDAREWIPEGGFHSALFVFFFPNPYSHAKYSKIPRRIGDIETTLLQELQLVCEKRKLDVASFEIYSKRGEVLDAEMKLSSIEGRCVFLVDIGVAETEKEYLPQEPPLKTTRRKMVFGLSKGKCIIL